MENSNIKGKEISLEEFKLVVRKYWNYLFSNLRWIFLTGLIAGIIGYIYAWRQIPVYTAEMTFAAETENASGGLGAYAGLAAQFGFDAGGGSAFEGENLVELLHSRRLIEKTLLTPVTAPDGSKELLINYYIKKNKLDKAWAKNPLLGKVAFTSQSDTISRQQDSIMKAFYAGFGKSLQIGKKDKRSDIFLASMSNEDEFFAKSFLEQLVNNVIQYYVDYKSKKSRQNVDILRRQTDSIHALLSGNIVDIAMSNDLNVNPIRQITQTHVQRKQVDAQANGALYAELVKNLELSKMALRKETPLIQIIDSPRYPLDKKKMSKLYTAALFAFAGGLLASAYFFFKKLLDL